MPSHFRCSQGQVPPLAAIHTGQILADMVLKEREEVMSRRDLANVALSEGVRAGHYRLLTELQEYYRAHPVLASRPLEQTAALFLQEKAHRRGWLWTTLHRTMASTMGALANLPLYSNVPRGISLNIMAPYWKAAMSTAKLRMQHAQPLGQTAVHREHVEIAVAEEPRTWVRAALILMWLSSCRVGCLLKLKVRDLTLTPEGEELRITIRFNQGKGVLARGPYAVGTKVVDSEWRAALEQHLNTRMEEAGMDALLFPATKETPFQHRNGVLLRALRVAHPSLNMRAMRRGSLQTMAAAGVPVETLMTRAGHTNTRTTLRYLNFGNEYKAGLEEGARIADALQPTPHPHASA